METEVNKMETTVNREKILESLEVIKNVCMQKSVCKRCPFYTKRCEIMHMTPANWILNNTGDKWYAIL